jgi:hypothetical protein
MAGRRNAPKAEPAPPKGDAGLFALLTDSTRIYRLTHILTNAPLTTNADIVGSHGAIMPKATNIFVM